MEEELVRGRRALGRAAAGALGWPGRVLLLLQATAALGGYRAAGPAVVFRVMAPLE